MSKILTGGSGDVNPQLLRGQVVQTGADTTTTGTFALPITRIPGSGKMVTIVEFLSMTFDFISMGSIASVAELIDTQTVGVFTQNVGGNVVAYDDAACICMRSFTLQGAFTAAGTYGTQYTRFQKVDLTDSAGHGILIATDNFFVQVSSINGRANTVRFHLLYRFKRVGLAEYIGVVTSQQ